MNLFEKLTTLCMRFPGIGSRQAGRFAFFLTQADESFIHDLLETIRTLRATSRQCSVCYRFFESRERERTTCTLCLEPRDESALMVVAYDTDLEAIHASGAYTGRYFVLGGVVPLLEKKRTVPLRTAELIRHIGTHAEHTGLKEVVIALSANPDGDHTALHIERLLEPLRARHALRITKLGRGLSTGTELEYSDADTIVHALKNRK